MGTALLPPRSFARGCAGQVCGAAALSLAALLLVTGSARAAGVEGGISSIDVARNTAVIRVDGAPVRVTRPDIPWFRDLWAGLNSSRGT